MSTTDQHLATARDHVAGEITEFGCDGGCGVDGPGVAHIVDTRPAPCRRVAVELRCGYVVHVDVP